MMQTAGEEGSVLGRPGWRLGLLVGLLAVLASCRAPGADARPDGYLVLWQEQEEGDPQEQEEDADEWGDDFDDFGDDFDDFGEEGDEGAGEPRTVYDPLSGFNRAMFVFNDKVYVWVLDPVARGWRWLAPEEVRIALGRMFNNAAFPVRFINDLLQVEFGKAGVELGRFLVNTTVGIGGLFDPADSWLGWKAPPPEDFGQTLGSYGLGPGFHLVLPLFGPSNLRDALSIIPDSFASPGYYLSTEVGLGVAVGERLNYTSLHIGEYESLRDDALDPYTFIRNAYEQNREKQIDE